MTSDARICFVIMPFSETESATEAEWTEIFESVFSPAVAAAGYTCRRSTPTRGSLLRGIIEDLDASWVVLADLTDRNANVFYELGVRHALQDRTILVAQDRDDIPFDLLQYANHVYSWRDEPGRADFAKTIRDLLEDVDRDPDRSDNPVSDFLGSARPRENPAAMATRLDDLEGRMQAFEGGLQLVGQPTGAAVGQKPAANALRAVSMLSEDAAPASWFEAGTELAHDEDLRELRAFVRDASTQIRELVPSRVAELNVRSGGSVERDQIGPQALEYEQRFAPLVAHLEEFALGLSTVDWPPGARAILELAGALVSAGEGSSGTRFATGLPAFFAWRLIVISGAASVHHEAWGNTASLIGEPIPVVRSGGRRTYRSLAHHHDLFFPEMLLGFADLGMKQLDSAFERAPHLETAIGTQDDYSAALAEFLILLALTHEPDDDRALYPGYRLLGGFADGLGHLLTSLRTRPDAATAIAAIFGLSPDDLRAGWSERAEAANEAKLGSAYWNDRRIPTDLNADEIQLNNW